MAHPFICTPVTLTVANPKTSRMQDVGNIMQFGISTHVANDAPRKTVNRIQLWRFLLVNGLIALAYFLTARASLSILQLGALASPVWPPAGIAFAALLWQGRWAGIGVALGVLSLNAALGVPWLLSAGSTLGSALQVVIGVTLLQRFGFCLSMDRLRDVLGFVGLAVFVTPMINATIGTATYSWVANLSWMQSIQNWWTIWLGDGMGILILTPSLLALQHWANQYQFKFAGLDSRWVKSGYASGLSADYCSGFITGTDRPSALEKWIWLSSFIAVSWIVFHSQPGRRSPCIPWSICRFRSLFGRLCGLGKSEPFSAALFFP
ncbi:MASE1 domain-containing protein [Egbenema bharatensis]|uniref:MASE1 domain-containing protein n=1 Tax=Egbenema bharatensis TaxID=3463334 RepID=UPI003A8C7FD3